MKQLACEMCGSTDLIKQDGVFVCQTCGTKYSVEEAKKMMIEGKVDVSGSEIKIDRSKQIENLRMLAYRAKSANDTQAAEKYFGQILVEDPEDWEASFYSTLYSASNCKVAQIGQAALQVGNVLDTVFELIQKKYDHMIENLQKDATKVDADKAISIKSIKAQEKIAYVDVRTATINFSTMLLDNILRNVGTTDAIINQHINDWFVPLQQMLLMLGDGLYQYFKEAAFAKEQYESVLKSREILSRTANGRQVMQIADRRIQELSLAEKKRKAEEAEKELSAQADRNRVYWAEHAGEKAELDAKIDSLTAESQPLKEQASQLSLQISELQSEMAPLTPAEVERGRLQNLLRDLRNQRASLGIFKGKEKKAVQAQIDEIEAALPNVKRQAEQERANVATATQEKIAPLRKEYDSLSARIRSIEALIREAKHELTRNR